MTKYLISSGDGATTFPEGPLSTMADAAHTVVQETKHAGVWILGGLSDRGQASVVATGRAVTNASYPKSKEHPNGFAVVDLFSRDEALEWAAKIELTTPHVPHDWKAQMFVTEESHTPLGADLLGQLGDGPRLPDNDAVLDAATPTADACHQTSPGRACDACGTGSS